MNIPNIFEIAVEEKLIKKWKSKDIDENDEEGKILFFGKYSKLLSMRGRRN